MATNEDEKGIVITITDNTGVDENGDGEGDEKKPKKPKIPGSIRQLVSQHIKNEAGKEVWNLGCDLLTYGINFSISNIGNFTGNYLQQANASATWGFVQKGVGLCFNTAKNFALYGPIGGAAMTAIGIGMDILHRAENVHQISIQNKITNNNIDMIRQRAGLDQLNDGSRGTDN